MMMFRWAMFLVGLAMMTSGQATGEVTLKRLRCEYAVNPIGIDVARPRLSWVIEADGFGLRQRGYQVLVATSRDALDGDRGDLWDSGQVDSDDSVHVVYEGKPLASGQRAWWKVRVWLSDGRVSSYSEPALWEMGLLAADEWKAKWICRDRPLPEQPEDFYKDDPIPLFRTEFKLDATVKRARAYVSGLGYYELRLNGQRVGDRILDPAWTTYARRVLYSTYDVTEQLEQGSNAVGLIVGNGWYNPLPMTMWGWLNLREHLLVGCPRVILQLDIELADGTRRSVVTDPGWKVGGGPILRNNVYLGEVYDARREQTGWDRAGFEDSDWSRAVGAAKKVGPLRAQMLPPVRVTRVLKPVAVTSPLPDVYIFDFGQNFTGVVQLRVRGTADRRISLRYGELLYPDGTLNPMTSVAGQIKKAGVGGPGAPDVAWQQDTYICKGEGEEVYVPRFTFHGFRYVEVSGLGYKPEPEMLEGRRFNSDVEQTGVFVCSNAMFNRIQQITEWTQYGNMVGLQSDCPHREKFGYGGDLVAASEMGLFNFDMARFYAKIVRDFADTAWPDGRLAPTAPFVGIEEFNRVAEDSAGAVGWGAAHPLLCWQLYRHYGDKNLLAEQYDVARRWVEFIRSRANGNLLHDDGVSDHESLVEKPIYLTGSAFYYYNVELLTRIARVLGNDDDARRYGTLAEQIREAFNGRFLEADTGRYDIGTQAAQAFALYMNLVPEGMQARALDVLVREVLDAHDGHLATGIFGTKYMLDVLSEHGRADVAYTIVNQRDFPGWGHMLAGGATTLWETWKFSDNVYSHNHPMFGSVSEWFYKVLAGIDLAPDAAGGDRFVIQPRIVEDLTWAMGYHMSVRGPVGCDWRVEEKKLHMTVTIPVNAQAEIHVPVSAGAAVLVNGQPAADASELSPVERTDEAAIFNVGSGTFAFRVEGFERG